jgi:predicted  nucleic acid-binding Zn-ribbon protein
MRVLSLQEERQREIELLNNLQDDMAVLENAWKAEKISPKKTVSHLSEIVESVYAIARAESLEYCENVCADIRETLNLIQYKKRKLEASVWTSIAELMRLTKTSLQEEGPAEIDPPSCKDNGRPAPAADSDNGQNDAAAHEHTQPPQEEIQMNKSLQTNVKELLQKAQEALNSGNGENAKQLAMQATEMLAKMEAEEARKKEKTLRGDLEIAVHEESEAEETFARIVEEKTDREKELNQLNTKLSEGRSTFNEKQQACQQVKEQVEKIEAEIASLTEQRKNLLEQFQEAFPARDASERECLRLKKELDKLTPDLELILDSFTSAESQLEKTRQKRLALEEELDKLSAKTC